MAYQDKLERAKKGFTVVPNLPEPQFKPNTVIPFNAATLNPGAQFASSGNNTLIVNPGGESTTTNFPTSRDYGAGGTAPQPSPLNPMAPALAQPAPAPAQPPRLAIVS